MESAKKKYIYYSAIGTLMLLFLLLTEYVSENPINIIDINVSRFLQNQSWTGTLLVTNRIVVAKSFRFIYLLLIASFFYLRRYAMVLCVFMAALSEAVSYVVKYLIARPRPVAGIVSIHEPLMSGYSFISGHTLEFTLLFGFLGASHIINTRNYLKKYIIASAFLIASGMVGLGRVYSGAHWFTDVLGSYILAALFLLWSLSFCKGVFIARRSFK